MQFLFIGLTLLLLAVALFALQNSEAVTVQFLIWQFRTSLATVILGSTAGGALMAGLLGIARRLSRLPRSPQAGPAAEPPLPPPPPPVSPGSGPPTRPRA